jgi:hypothetical protein
MKKSCLVVALLVGVAALPLHAQTRKQIIAGPIEVAGDTISGSFRVKDPSHTGIRSIGTGGACLVADLDNRACRADDDCVDLRTKYHPDGSAYCLQAAGKRKRTCWVRGADLDYCRKSPMVPLPLNTNIGLPVIDPRGLPNTHRIAWRVLACLNGYDEAAGTGNRACADPTGMSPKMISAGPPRRIP